MLHICCGVCAAGVAGRLMAEGHQVMGLFYNPNIYPPDEYHRRLEVAQEVARRIDFPLVVPPYRPEEFTALAEPLKDEPEGGRRCEVCFRLRLEKTFAIIAGQGCDAFATTLTVSPHKSALAVNRVGAEIGGERFLQRDFKKQGGFKETMALARQWGLYRQNYCGCVYSLRERQS